MENLESIIFAEPSELLAALPTYQEKLIQELLRQDSSYLNAADKWLISKPSNTVGFGGNSNNPILYRDVILDELEKFLCGDKKYNDDRNKIGTSIKVGIGAIAHGIGVTLGVAGPYILPVVVLLLINMGKIPLNAWCEMRKKEKKQTTVGK